MAVKLLNFPKERNGKGISIFPPAKEKKMVKPNTDRR
jgi:hypothetical protein